MLMPRRPPPISYCTSRDGVRIAFSTAGSGPPLVRAAHWISHLEADWDNVVWRPWLKQLTRRHTLVRYDTRGCGLSDGDGVEFSMTKYIEDLEAVVNAAGLDRFALMGMSGGGALAVAYAATHPDRVSQLVLYGAFTRGLVARSTTPEQQAEAETLFRLIEQGWSKEDPTFRQFFAAQFLPDGDPAHQRAFNELMRLSSTARNAASLMRVWCQADVRELALRVRCPALVGHPRGDLRVPFEEGRSLARLIPGARFVPLDTRNHIVLDTDPAWDIWWCEFETFLSPPADAPGPQPASPPAARPTLAGLTPREHEVLDQVARGLDNQAIAERLSISEKTVRNQVSLILNKLGLQRRSQAIVLARERGFGLSPP